MKKVLFVATVVKKHINAFHIPCLKMLKENGYQTYVAAANDTGCPNVVIQNCDNYYEVKFERNPFNLKNISAYFSLKKIVDAGNFDIVHCHTPVGGFLTRLASINARKRGTKVFYTAHGFHFFKGAPLLNWLVFYPVEWVCSFFTDTLITINKEDYELAKKHMHAKRVEYVPGVGIDVDKFKNTVVNKSEKRKELGIPEDAFLLVSVGELNKNKNHEVVIRAIAQIDNDNIHYAIAGVGELKDYLLNLTKELKIDDRVHLLGFRKDVAEIYKAGDVYIHPSFREGLPVSVMEAIASGLPIAVSDTRGCRDLCNKRYIFNANDIKTCSKKILELFFNKNNYLFLDDIFFEIDKIQKRMRELYGK